MKTAKFKSNFFEMRVRPGFIVWLFILFVGVPYFFYMRSEHRWSERSTTKWEMVAVARLYQFPPTDQSSLTLNSNGCLLPHLLGNEARTRISSYLRYTNDAGELIDKWRTPFRIRLTEGSNLVIHSAGPDHQFGSKDDLVFDSASNSFVKP